MDERPATEYALAPDGVRVAYQVFGEGLDLLLVPSMLFPIDLLWDEPGFIRFAERLGRFSRTVLCEPRGIGASGGDPRDGLVGRIANADVTAVLDAAGCERVVLVGANHGGPTVIGYAVAHPEKVSALVLIDTYAHYMSEDDYPWGLTQEMQERIVAVARESWGSGMAVQNVAPSKMGDARFCAWFARSERLGVGPDTVAGWLVSAAGRDARQLLSAVSVPTLVLHRAGNRIVEVHAGLYLGEHIPAARYVELPGEDFLFFVGDTDALLDEVEEFLTGTRQAPEGNVVTATILFTDIVASTEQSARMGHRKWVTLVDQHDDMVRATLGRHRGREVKTIGDGFLATFDAATRAVRAAMEIAAAAKQMGLDVRTGVHIGEVEVRPDDVLGLPVSIAKRICDLAGPGAVFVSEAANLHLVGSGISTSEQGTHALKGVPGEWRLFAAGG